MQAQILSQRTFTIFVVMALLTTFATTPIVTLLYPPWYQKKLAAWKRGEIDWDSETPTGGETVVQQDHPSNNRIGQLLVYLRLDNMPGLLSLVALFGKDTIISDKCEGGEKQEGVVEAVTSQSPPTRAVRAHGLRLLQLGDRDSSVMTVSEVDEYTKTDPVVNTWRTVGQILRVAVSGEVATMPESRFSEALLVKSSDISSDLLLLPWSGTGSLGDPQMSIPDSKQTSSYIAFTNSVLSSTQQNIGIFFPSGSGSQDIAQTPERLKLQRAYSFSDIHRDIQPLPVKNKAQRIILPFFGGKDDRFALMLVLQLCERQEVTATVFHIMADDSSSSSEDREYLDRISSMLPTSVSARIEFKFAPSNDAGEELVTSTSSSLREDSGDVAWNNLIVLGRRGSAGKLPRGGKTAPARASDELIDCLGNAAGILLGSNIKADLLVVQAKSS